MTDIVKDCELYAKVIEGIIVVENEWQPGHPERREPRETLLKAAAEIVQLRALSKTILQKHIECCGGAWQPIQTAPFQRTVILSRIGEQLCVTAYRNGPVAGWRHAHSSEAICFEPTHWTNLPVPPALASTERSPTGNIEGGA